jgi:hypothetical protein
MSKVSKQIEELQRQISTLSGIAAAPAASEDAEEQYASNDVIQRRAKLNGAYDAAWATDLGDNCMNGTNKWFDNLFNYKLAALPL